MCGTLKKRLAKILLAEPFPPNIFPIKPESGRGGEKMFHSTSVPRLVMIAIICLNHARKKRIKASSL
jgi:hypothetical protein